MVEKQYDFLTYSGIYVIINIKDFKAYVGQATEFSTRDHWPELEAGKDNSKLQAEYDIKEKELIYFVAFYDVKPMTKMELDFYEKLYMTLMESIGFELYNIDIKAENRTIEVLAEIYKIAEKTVREFYEQAKEEILKDLKFRFNSDIKTLQESKSARHEALNYYMKKRLYSDSNDRKKIRSDRVFLTELQIESLLGEKKGIEEFKIDQVFFSKIGNYLNEGIDQILKYELDTIKKYGYSVWTFGHNAISYETVLSKCKSREKQNLDNYVIFQFTPSSVYSASPPTKYVFVEKECQKNVEKELIELGLVRDVNGKYSFPDDIECTAASDKTCCAFIIEEFYYINRIVDENIFDEIYEVVGKYGNYSFKDRGKQRNTVYTELIREDVDCYKPFVNPKRRSFCVLAKLKSPFIVKLEKAINYAHWDEPDFSLPKELILKENSFLHEAISVFYVAGGYDFFKVVDPKKYATGWLDFLGNLYAEIMAGKYKKDINRYENPLSDSERISLIEQGVPNIFTEKIIEIKATIIYLEDSVLLSKKEYDNWKDCQDEYYEKYKTNVSPMSYEEISSFFAEDFGQEEEWPFSKKEILEFFESDKMVMQSER